MARLSKIKGEVKLMIILNNNPAAEKNCRIKQGSATKGRRESTFISSSLIFLYFMKDNFHMSPLNSIMRAPYIRTQAS